MRTHSNTQAIFHPGKNTFGVVALQRVSNPDRVQVTAEAVKALSQVIGGTPEYIGPWDNGGELAWHAFFCQYARPILARCIPTDAPRYQEYVTQVYNNLAYNVGPNPILVEFSVNWRSGDVTYPVPVFKNATITFITDYFPVSSEPDMYADQYKQHVADMLGAEAAVRQAWANLIVKAGAGLAVGPIVFAPDMVKYLLDKAGGTQQVLNTVAQTGANALGGTIKSVTQTQQAVANALAQAAGTGIKAATGFDMQAPFGFTWKQIALVGGLAGVGLYLYNKKDIDRVKTAVKKTRNEVATAVLKTL